MATIDTIKMPDLRVKTRYNSAIKISTFGEDNSFPQNLIRVIKSSATAVLCTNKYRKNIEGQGFLNEDIANLIVNDKGDTLNDILSAVCRDYSYGETVAYHVNYSLKGQVITISQIPWEELRISEPDNRGYSAFIVRHPDWSGTETQNGKVVPIDIDHVEKYNVFNPTPSVVRAEIQEAGGIEKYKGQILYISEAGINKYATPKASIIMAEISTDEGLSNVCLRNVRNNFYPAGFLVKRKANVTSVTNAYNNNGKKPIGTDKIKVDIIAQRERERAQKEQEENDAYNASLKQMQGDNNVGKLGSLTIGLDEEVPVFLDMHLKNYDKEFTVTDARTISRIYAMYGQEIYHSIRIGKLGFSGQIARDAFEQYSNETETERTFISRSFNRILKASIFVKNTKKNIAEIKPLQYNSTEK